MKYEIEMSHVNAGYHHVVALNDVTLKLPFGKIYGLLGRNGQAKRHCSNC